MKVIALEEHLDTSEVKQAQSSSQNQEDAANSFCQEKVDQRLLDLTEARTRDMDESGIDVQVLSLTTPGVQNLESSQAIELAKRTNDWIAQTVQAKPDRFQGFATLPTPAPKAAATELERAVTDLGLVGAMVFGRTREQNFDHADNEPIFEAASALGVPLYLHPQIPQQPVRAAYYSGFDDRLNAVLSTAGVGWHFETGIQFLRLILAGVFDRYPDLQIILGHWGEMVLFYLDRLDEIPKIAQTQQDSISKYFKRNLYVTPSGIFSQTYLEWAKQVIGINRILFAMDYPYVFEPEAARSYLENSSLNSEEREKVAHGNWERLMAARKH